MRGFDGQTQHAGVERSHLLGTGEKDVFKRRSLKDAVVGSVNDKVRIGKEMRHREARADGILIDQKLVVVPAQTGGDGPISVVDEVLYVGGLLQIRTSAFGWKVSGEDEGERSAGVERIVGIVRIARDYVTEVLVKKFIVGIDSGL